jgi:hypothetical protein
MLLANPAARQSEGPVHDTPFSVLNPVSGFGLDPTDHDVPSQDMMRVSEEPELVGMSPTATQSEPVEPRHVTPFRTPPFGPELGSRVHVDPSHISIMADSTFAGSYPTATQKLGPVHDTP